MNEREIFAQALDIADPAERQAFLLEACGVDHDLRRHIGQLLRSQMNLGNFLDVPVLVPSEALFEPAAYDGPGDRIGPYRLLEPIGEGGMGVVYMAEQQDPVRRKVALKIVKPGLDSRQVIARFEAERQALAMMDHPNIARVYDAGTAVVASDEWRVASEINCLHDREGGGAEQGNEVAAPAFSRHSPLTTRHYFVMELVYGVPITHFCDQRRLTPRQRLELFVPVCQAIQHAHQKGVIHRDIKPSNVLVTMFDDKPVPKVIDFGVAKATDQRLTERTMFTHFGALIGTFEYMSPEQAEMNALGVDTRSDIYSLGVLLYELLTGTTPIERNRLHEAPLDEAMRLVREDEPPPPSIRMARTEDLPIIAKLRRMEPLRLSKFIRGEIDWIVMKCLEKDRSRRYDSAGALARDVERFLQDEPVEACPPSRVYRLRKYARRHWMAICTTTGFAILLLVGTAVCGWQAARATRAERDAITAWDTAALFREMVFDDPKLRGLPADHPSRATALILLGRTLLQTERPAQAELVLRECLAIREKNAPSDWPTFNACSLLGFALLAQHKYDEAEPLLLRGYGGLLQNKAKIPYTSLVHPAEVAVWLSQLYQKWGKPEQAEVWRKKGER
jgi:eukaryotic-like serine/threonine-protein kinase